MDKAFLDKIEECNAIHEAGHAVMAALTGTQIHSIVLPCGDVLKGFGYVRRQIAENAWKEVLIKLAGPGAEVIHIGSSWSDVLRSAGSADWREAQRYLKVDDKKTRRALVANAKSKVLQSLRNNWSWVSAVAVALLVERYLCGNQVLLLHS